MVTTATDIRRFLASWRFRYAALPGKLYLSERTIGEVANLMQWKPDPTRTVGQLHIYGIPVYRIHTHEPVMA